MKRPKLPLYIFACGYVVSWQRISHQVDSSSTVATATTTTLPAHLNEMILVLFLILYPNELFPLMSTVLASGDVNK